MDLAGARPRAAIGASGAAAGNITGWFDSSSRQRGRDHRDRRPRLSRGTIDIKPSKFGDRDLRAWAAAEHAERSLAEASTVHRRTGPPEVSASTCAGPDRLSRSPITSTGARSPPTAGKTTRVPPCTALPRACIPSRTIMPRHQLCTRSISICRARGASARSRKWQIARRPSKKSCYERLRRAVLKPIENAIFPLDAARVGAPPLFLRQ